MSMFKDLRSRENINKTGTSRNMETQTDSTIEPDTDMSVHTRLYTLQNATQILLGKLLATSTHSSTLWNINPDPFLRLPCVPTWTRKTN